MEDKELIRELKEIKTQLKELMKSMTLLLGVVFQEMEGEEEGEEDSIKEREPLETQLEIFNPNFEIKRSYLG